MTPPVALSIAGSDSGGCAGIQADLRTFAAYGVLGTTALTSVTAQNGTQVRSALALPSSLVREQVEAVLDDMPIRAAKTGLLPNEAVVMEVAALAPRLPLLVVDPVMVATSGQRLADRETVGAYRRHLLPVAAVVTPNLSEAAALLGDRQGIRDVDHAREAARRLGEIARTVVVKGAPSGDGEVVVDVVWDGEGTWELPNSRVKSPNTHGSGCTFSAAIAAGLARGLAVRSAIEDANRFVHRAIEGSANWKFGVGAGPLDHLGWGDRQ